MNDDEVDLMEVLEGLVTQVSYLCETKQDILKVWIHFGRLLGINMVLPHVRVAMTEDDKGNLQPILLVASPCSELSDYMTSTNLITEKIADICLEEIKQINEKAH